MHNDAVKLRAGAVQREANYTGRSVPNLIQSFRHVNFNCMLCRPWFQFA